MSWYTFEDCRGWTATTNNRDTAVDWFRRWKRGRGDMQLKKVTVDGRVVWPKQLEMSNGRS